MTHHVPVELQNYVRQSIIPQYANFDKAPQIDHVEKVMEESLKLAAHYEVDYSMVYVIAAYHDLGLYEGREFHHITSGKVLLADETLRRWFTDEQDVYKRQVYTTKSPRCFVRPTSLRNRVEVVMSIWN